MSLRFNTYILVALLGLIPLSNTCYAELKSIDSAELQLMIEQGVTVIDIRRPDEWQQTGIIPGSKMLMFYDRWGRSDATQWLQDAGQWLTDDRQPFVLVCRSGGRTGRAGRLLADRFPMRQVYHLEGGISAWLRGQHTVDFPD